MILSDITLNEIRMTGMSHLLAFVVSHIIAAKSFMELILYLFQIEGVTCFLSEKLSQDALEKFFGCQRQKGKTNDNPTVYEFLKNTQALRIIDSIHVKDITGNCRGTKRKLYDLESVDLEKPLKKRRRHLSS